MPVAARKSTICRSSPRGLQTVVPRSASVGLEAWYAASQCGHVWRQCSGVCSHVHRRLNQPDPVSWAISWVPSIMPGSWDSFLVTVPDPWSKGCEFESRQERRENFLLQSQLCVLTFIRCPLHPHTTAVACKRPRSFYQKWRWQVTPKYAYTHDPMKSEWADYAAVQT